MNKQSVINITFVALSFTAVIVGIWGFLTGSGATSALISAVLLLVAGQLLLFFILYKSRNERLEGKPELIQVLKSVAKTHKRLGRIERKMVDISKIEGRLEEAFRLELHNNAQQIHPIIADQSVQLNQNETRTEGEVASNAQQRPSMTPSKQMPAPPFDGPAYLDDSKLSLYLEPIVDIVDLSTAFYRAEMACQNELGERIKVSELDEEIERAGHASDVDMKLFTLLGPVIDRLATRGSVKGVVCPMSRHSFANETFLAEFTSYLQYFPNLAKVVIIDISQANLAGLSDDGMAGLAFLAQAGATFCLGGTGLDSPDLASLSSLGFRYLDLDFSDNISRYGWQAFAAGGQASELGEAAKTQNIKIIGSGMVRKSQYNALNNFIHFGRGTIFSPPRLVRTDLTEQQALNNAA